MKHPFSLILVPTQFGVSHAYLILPMRVFVTYILDINPSTNLGVLHTWEINLPTNLFIRH